jgi:hypothetical protein
LSLHSNPTIIIDKRGQTVFFPWLIRGKGYVVPEPETKRRLDILLSSSIWMFILLGILVLFLPSFSFFAYIGVLIIWLVLYFLFVEAITKSLPAYPLSYKELILDNISSSADETSND